MKKFYTIALTLLLLIGMLSACDSNTTKDLEKETEVTEPQVVSKMEEVFNSFEYQLWCNIFYNGILDGYIDKEVTKEGTFTTLQDEFSKKTRYYVWGYSDKTKCCDFMWEINPEGLTEIPKNGSKVKVSGKLVLNANDSLDGVWITDAKVEIKNIYESQYDIDMTTMGGTLEMVQVINLQNAPQAFSGKTVKAYGRVLSRTSFQHPYYDEVFVIQTDNATNIAIGTPVTVSGTIGEDGNFTNAIVEKT